MRKIFLILLLTLSNQELLAKDSSSPYLSQGFQPITIGEGADEDLLAVIVNNDYKVLGQAEGYTGQGVRAFAEDPSGAVWIGTGSGSLYRFNPDTGVPRK